MLDQQHYSTTFGVNQRALLNTLRHFDVTAGALIPDIMHDILEGALPLQLMLVLKMQYVAYLRLQIHISCFDNGIYWMHAHVQVIVPEQKLFTLDFIDEQFKNLNLQYACLTETSLPHLLDS